MKTKKNKSNSIPVDDEIYEGIERGVVYCLFHPNETLKYIDVIKSFKHGQRRRVSPITGAAYICKIAICECGAKRVSKRVLTSLCLSCQRKAVDARRTKKAYRKPVDKTKPYHQPRAIDNSEVFDLERFDCWRRIYCVDKFAGIYANTPCKNCGGYEPMGLSDMLLTVDRPEVIEVGA